MRPVAVNCGTCGSKINKDRMICPRCRARLVPEAPAGRNEGTSLAVMLTAVGLGIALIGGVTYWLRDGQPGQAPPAATVGDPFAARRAKPSEPAAPVSEAPRTAPAFFEAKSEGATAYSTGEYEASVEHYRAAIDKNPQDAESLSNLGQVLVRLGRVDEAIPYFDRAIAIIPQRWAYHFNRARALGLLGKTEEAVKGYRDAQQLFPNDYATAFNLGLALHKLGDEGGAVDAYKKAIAIDPNDASFHLALGTSLERLQRAREAAEAYGDYLRLAPSAPDADQVRARIAQLTQASPAPQPGT